MRIPYMYMYIMFCIVMYCFTCDTVCNISVVESKFSPLYHLSIPPGASQTRTPTQPQSALGPCPLRK